MKMNLKLRLKNKTTLISFITCLITLVYQVLGVFEVVPEITQDMAIQLVGIVANVLVGLGVLVDPTTKGIADSERAMEYTELN